MFDNKINDTISEISRNMCTDGCYLWYDYFADLKYDALHIYPYRSIFIEIELSKMRNTVGKVIFPKYVGTVEMKTSGFCGEK